MAIFKCQLTRVIEAEWVSLNLFIDIYTLVLLLAIYLLQPSLLYRSKLLISNSSVNAKLWIVALCFLYKGGSATVAVDVLYSQIMNIQHL